MLSQVLAIVVRIYNVVATILGIVNTVEQTQLLQATVAKQDTSLTNEAAILTSLLDPSTGLAAIKASLDALTTATVSGIDAIEAQITAFSPGGTTVQIQPIDTGNVTTALLDLIAVYVWSFPDPNTANAMVDELSNVWAYSANSDGNIHALTVDQNAPWQLVGGNNPLAIYSGDPFTPTLDWTTILASDATPVDWLNRVFGVGTVTDAGSGVPMFSTGSGHFQYVPWLDTMYFTALKRALGIIPSGVTAPVWPGLAGVTLGTPVAISLSFTVTGPMQGVLVALTGVPSLKGHYDYDGLDQALKIGALTFVSDNGDAEYVQALGFTTEVYVPKNMASADSCKVRAVSGVTGTVTPFTIP